MIFLEQTLSPEGMALVKSARSKYLECLNQLVYALNMNLGVLGIMNRISQLMLIISDIEVRWLKIKSLIPLMLQNVCCKSQDFKIQFYQKTNLSVFLVFRFPLTNPILTDVFQNAANATDETVAMMTLFNIANMRGTLPYDLHVRRKQASASSDSPLPDVQLDLPSSSSASLNLL